MTKNRFLLGIFTVVVCVGAQYATARDASAPRHTVTGSGGHFVLDGKMVQIISGEMHCPRIPQPYWRDRLLKAKAMGLNAVSVYAFRNVHEPHPSEWDFSGAL